MWFIVIVVIVSVVIYKIQKYILQKKQRQQIEKERVEKDVDRIKKRLSEVSNYDAAREAEIKWKLSQEKANEAQLKAITEAFARNNWTRWDSSVHKESGQLERLKRATDSSNPVRLVRYNPIIKIAKIRGTKGNYYLTSGERCSCPDYRKRNKPCKHMYFLATVSDDYRLEDDTSLFSSCSVDNVLGGLKFSIAGRNQLPVKSFIVEHGGVFINFNPNKTDALIVIDDKVTGKVINANICDMQIMTFDDLQNLF